jgi:uncharacterized membrane protein YkvA (DUF1232 family)
MRRIVRRVKTETYALYLVGRDPRTPWYAKVLAAAVVAYAASPIDLLPDFIPVIGYLDDLVILPLGAWVTVRLVPAEVMADARLRAEDVVDTGLPGSRSAAVVVVVLWVVLAAAAALLALRFVPGRG